MNQSETAKLVAILRASWPRTEIPDIETMVTAYHLGLRTADYADAEQAVAECIESCTFMPTVAEIRERMPKPRRQLDGKLYNRFHELHGSGRTAVEDREYRQVCHKLGIDWIADARGPVDVEVPASRPLLQVAS
ncbi:MAG: hypothetical protein MOGMAGMI_01887 [Candidatus Omnitrophica bacterium]|nr:hypothetical protein [Candidatus Omnitrophota bacterium]